MSNSGSKKGSGQRDAKSGNASSGASNDEEDIEIISHDIADDVVDDAVEAIEADDVVDDDAAGDVGEKGERVRLLIKRKLPGRRVDKYLHGRFARLSRTLIQKMIKSGQITVNGRPTKPSYEIEVGDEIDLTVPAPEPYEVIPEEIPLDIVYEDDYVLAINKQAGIICHPARATQTGTLANGLAHYASSLSSVNSDPFRPGIVHRLDKNTTGLMIIAKTDEAHWKLAKQFEDRTTRKVYMAVVHGTVELDGDMIDVPLKQHSSVHDRYVVSGLAERLGGRFKRQIEREAVTQYEVLDRYGMYSLVRLFPKTGRTHQLRVHMSYINHPMAGDPFYGGSHVSVAAITGNSADPATPFFTRQALHAYKLTVKHPIEDRLLELEAPLPEDMKNLIALLEANRREPQKARRRPR